MRWKFLLKPGWLALTLVVFIFAVSCYTLLAPWQFQRHDERATQNAAVQASFTASPEPLSAALPDDQIPDVNTQWQRVVIEGTYLPEAEVVARLRTVQGEPAFEVLTPMRTTDGDVALIDRGYVRPDDRTRVPPYAAPPEGVVRVEARVRIQEQDPQGRPAFSDESTDGKLHSYAINPKVVGDAGNLDIRPGYFQLENDQPGVLGPLPLPQLDAGPFLSYALQWIAFGTMALLGWLYFTVRELKPGGALAGDEPRPEKRKSVAQILAEDEAAEREERANAS
ncbi:SURF1 family cytochrome oxidase biogenesis protein [Saccharomonospora sp. NPDC006951]